MSRNIIRIKRVLLKMHVELHNIAGNKKEPFTLFMKKALTQIADSYPEHLKKENPDSQTSRDLDIYVFSEKTKKELQNIFKNSGCTTDFSGFLKVELQKILSQYPDADKQPPEPEY